MAVLYTLLILLFCAFAPRRFYRLFDKYNIDPIEEWFLGWVVIVVLFIVGLLVYLLYLKIDSNI